MFKTSLQYRTNFKNFTKNPSQIEENNSRFGRLHKNINKISFDDRNPVYKLIVPIRYTRRKN